MLDFPHAAMHLDWFQRVRSPAPLSSMMSKWVILTHMGWLTTS